MFRNTVLQLFMVVNIYLLSTKNIYQIKLRDLDSLLSSGESDISSLEDVLSTDGALAITNFPQDYKQAVRQLKQNAPQCLKTMKLPEFNLPDGSRRRTFAVEMEDDIMSTLYPDCIDDVSETISKQFDKVNTLMSNLIIRIAGNGNLGWKRKGDDQNKDIRNFTSSSYKEHVHVYEPLEGLTDDTIYAAPFHTDNGLLLTITPFQEHPLQMKNIAGELVTTDQVGDDSVLVLIAGGLPHWLLHGTKMSSKFFPVPHAVPSLANDVQSRTVFARMKVVPRDAVPVNMANGDRHDQVLFEDFFKDTNRRATPMELCPMTQPLYQKTLLKSWSQLKKQECDTNQAYCWMNCLEIPEDCREESQPKQCLNMNDVPCCTDTVTEGCENMDSSCHWTCSSNHTTHDHGGGTSAALTDGDQPFCNGYGTDMYMKGFTTSGNSKDACVILLFKSWILDTRLKFFFGCVGVILLGIGVEGMLCLRRKIQSRKILLRMSGVVRRVSIISLFSLNIASGYFAMLVAMTYSVELFICMVIGLVIGHAIFNSGAPVGESVDPCCASQAIAHPNDVIIHNEDNNTIGRSESVGSCCKEPTESIDSTSPCLHCYDNDNYRPQGALNSDCECFNTKAVCDCV